MLKPDRYNRELERQKGRLLNRRNLLTMAALAPLAGCAAGVGGLQNRRIETLGLQLYTVRDLMTKDTAGTLAQVAAAGYGEVETAGTGTLTPGEFAVALDNVGLTAPSAHVPVNLLASQPEELLKLAQALGHRYLVVPWLPPPLRTASGYAMVIKLLNEFGERCAQENVQLCYHNHDFEFENVDGTRPMDRLLAECDNRLVKFELDLYWAAHAGVDAAAYLAADPTRFPLCHVKDRGADGNMVDVGAGQIDFATLFAAGSGLQHYFVEHDKPADPLATIRNSSVGLRAVRY